MSEEMEAAIRARADAATPGPWKWCATMGMIEAWVQDAPGAPVKSEYVMWLGNIPGGLNDDSPAAMRVGALGERTEADADANFAFLANARQDVPFLLALVDELRVQNGYLARQGK